MKAVILVMITFVVCASGTDMKTTLGGGDYGADWRTSLGGGDYGSDWRTGLNSGDVSDNWRKPINPEVDISDLTKLLSNRKTQTLGLGSYIFDSDSNRWLIKTNTRVLSLNNIELVDHFYSKQTEVIDLSSSLKSKNNSISNRYLERSIKRNVKFEKYDLKDFKY